MLLLKIFITAVVVLFVTILTERKGGRIGGIVAGFPTASAIIILFIGLEHSQEFVQTALTSSLLGFLSIFLFEWIYIVGLKNFPFTKILTPIVSVSSVFLANFFLQFLSFSFWEVFLFVFLSIVGAHFLFLFLQPIDEKITKKKLSLGEMLFRIFFPSFIIISISESTKILGAEYSGTLVAFPCITFSTILILQRYNSPEQITTFLKHLPLGLLSTFGFMTSLFLILPYTGFLWAWFLSFVSAFIILVMQFFVRNISHKKFRILSSFSSSS
jgi:uncharacterized membrane protein (GlpM family)